MLYVAERESWDCLLSKSLRAQPVRSHAPDAGRGMLGLVFTLLGFGFAVM